MAFTALGSETAESSNRVAAAPMCGAAILVPVFATKFFSDDHALLVDVRPAPGADVGLLRSPGVGPRMLRTIYIVCAVVDP